MDTILIAGVDTILGANLAASFAAQARVVGVCSTRRLLPIAGCEIGPGPADSPAAVEQLFAAVRPRWTILCDETAESGWPGNSRPEPTAGTRVMAEAWSRAAAEHECDFTFVSSDAVFTGPWLFHREESETFCDSPQARLIRTIERTVLDVIPAALVVRTNAYGWSPAGLGDGPIERVLAALDAKNAVDCDALACGTPILATHLAQALKLSRTSRQRGVVHIAGSERIGVGEFLVALARRFGLPVPRSTGPRVLEERPRGFGRGETSLHTGRFREATGASLPTIADGLTALFEQQSNGYRERLGVPACQARERAA